MAGCSSQGPYLSPTKCRFVTVTSIVLCAGCEDQILRLSTTIEHWQRRYPNWSEEASDSDQGATQTDAALVSRVAAVRTKLDAAGGQLSEADALSELKYILYDAEEHELASDDGSSATRQKLVEVTTLESITYFKFRFVYLPGDHLMWSRRN